MSIHTTLPDVSLKILRAKEHLEAVRDLDHEFANIDCEVVFREDPDEDHGWLELRLPEAPKQLSLIVGDCLHNLRSALDYLVWQLVLANPPNRPTRRNMFPICSSPDLFANQIRGGRLSGIHPRAKSVIEGLQPYADPQNPLLLVDALNNTDKHRCLNLAVAVASDLDLGWLRNGKVVARTFIGNEDVCNGAHLLGYRLSEPAIQIGPGALVRGRANAFLAFREPPFSEDDPASVVAMLESAWDFIANEVVFALAPFVELSGATKTKKSKGPNQPFHRTADAAGEGQRR